MRVLAGLYQGLVCLLAGHEERCSRLPEDAGGVAAVAVDSQRRFDGRVQGFWPAHGHLRFRFRGAGYVDAGVAEEFVLGVVVA